MIKLKNDIANPIKPPLNGRYSDARAILKQQRKTLSDIISIG